jgi:hypothetical protein
LSSADGIELVDGITPANFPVVSRELGVTVLENKLYNDKNTPVMRMDWRRSDTQHNKISGRLVENIVLGRKIYIEGSRQNMLSYWVAEGLVISGRGTWYMRYTAIIYTF